MNETGTMVQAGPQRTPELLCELMRQMAFVIKQKEARLQIEENATEIAKMQGYLAGFRKYGTIIMTAGFDYDYRVNIATECPWVDDDKAPDYSELLQIHLMNSELQKNETYKAMAVLLESEIDQKKDFLFYQSEKSRDMHWCKGWYQAISQVEGWIETLENSYELETKRKSESLPFED